MKPVILTHDAFRKNGIWKCCNCGKIALDIRDLNLTECPNRPTDNANIIVAITKA